MFRRFGAKKQRIAEALVTRAINDRSGVISSQVVQEFLNVATRKFKRPMTAVDGRIYLDGVLRPLGEVFPSFALYELTLQLQEETRYSFYDSLMIASALEANCRRLYSEDLQSGQKIRNLMIENPFI